MKLRRKILLVSITIITIVLLSISYVLIRQMYSAVLSSKIDGLTAIANIQKSRVEDYFDHGYENIDIIANQSLLLEKIKEYNLNPKTSIKNEIANIINVSKKANDEFYDIYVFGPDNKLITTSSGVDEISPSDENIISSNMSDTKYSVLVRDPKQSYVLFHSPIINGEGFKIGSIVLKESTGNIDDIVKDYDGLGDTGETQLATKDKDGSILFLHDQRFTNVSVDNQKSVNLATNRAMSIALKGSEGEYTDTIDYRGVRVVSITRYIPGIKWGLVVKQDREEVYRAMYIAEIAIVIMAIILWLVMFLIVRWFINLIFNRLDIMREGTVVVKEGDLSYRFKDNKGDEISELAQSFDEMTDSLQISRQEVDKKVKAQTEDIIDKNDKLKEQQVAILSILEDIEYEKNISIKAAQDLQKFEQAVAGVSDHIVITDPDGVILYANKSVERITGFKKSETIGKKAGSKELWGGQMPKSEYEKFWHRIKIEKKPYVGILTNHRKNGEIYEAEANVSPILDKNGKIIYFVGIEKDVTDEHRALLANERLANIVKYSSDAIYGLSVDGIITDWNLGAERVFGYKGKEIIGKSILILVPEHLQDYVKGLIANIAAGKNLGSFRTKRMQKNGNVIDVEISNSPMKDHNGKIMGSSSVARDITKELQIDRAKTEIVSLASHQLRTPLSAINWYAEMLINGDVGELNKYQKEYLSQIYNSNHRMVDLVNSLLNVSRLDLGTFAVDPKRLSLVEVSKNAINELKATLQERKQKITEEYDKDIPIINADPKLVLMIFQNLLSNASKYTKVGGKIHVSIKNKGDKYIEIEVADNGIGIPVAQQDKIFTKMFRADNARLSNTDGTGLGMYIVKSILDQVGGSVGFKSVEGKGTKFTVELPKAGMKEKQGTKKLE